MVKKICLDSDVLIELLHGNEDVKNTLASINGELFTTSVSVFEVWYGRKKSETVSELLDALHILSLEKMSAMFAADMFSELNKKGESLDLKDVFIAAMCIRNEVVLYTFNKKHFQRMEKFGLVLL